MKDWKDQPVKKCRECPALKFNNAKEFPICRVTQKEITDIDILPEGCKK